MPAISNIVIANAVPVNLTLNPLSASLALSTWQQKDAAIFDGNARLAMALSMPSSSRKTARAKVTLTIPVIRTYDDVPRVDDSMIFTMEGVVPSSISAEEALNGYTYGKNLFAHAVVQALFANREPSW